MTTENTKINNTGECPFADEGYAEVFALGALDGDDRARFVAHLPDCPICPARVTEARLIAAQLTYDLDDDALAMPPSPEVRARILAAIAAEETGQEGRPVSVDAAPGAAQPAPLVQFRRWNLQPYAVAALLLLVFGLGLLAWNISLQRELRQAQIERDRAQTTLQRYQLTSTTGTAAGGEVVYLRDQQRAVIVIHGLPALSAGQVYQVWLIQDGKPQPSTVFLTDTTAIQASLEGVTTIAITIEPGPKGSLAPTTSPLVAGAVR